jgi:hypothetical protein
MCASLEILVVAARVRVLASDSSPGQAGKVTDQELIVLAVAQAASELARIASSSMRSAGSCLATSRSCRTSRSSTAA